MPQIPGLRRNGGPAGNLTRLAGRCRPRRSLLHAYYKSQTSDQRRSHPDARKIALCGVLIALAMILSYLESLVPIHMAVPGVKLGLANLVTIIALQKLDLKSTVVISVGRIILSNVLFGNMAVLLYSLAGAACSILIMTLLKKCRVFGLVGISVAGAVFHNLGQILVAVCVMENVRIFYYMFILLITGTVAGVAIGLLASFLLKNIRI